MRQASPGQWKGLRIDRIASAVLPLQVLMTTSQGGLTKDAGQDRTLWSVSLGASAACWPGVCAPAVATLAGPAKHTSDRK